MVIMKKVFVIDKIKVFFKLNDSNTYFFIN